MPQPCKACTSVHRQAIERKLAEGIPMDMISAWLTAKDEPTSERALQRHSRNHLGLTLTPGRKPTSGDFAEAVRDAGFDDLREGRQRPTLQLSLAAQKLLDDRLAKKVDRDLLATISIALSGRVRVLDPEVRVLESEFSSYLEGATQAEALAARDLTEQRLLESGELSARLPLTHSEATHKQAVRGN